MDYKNALNSAGIGSAGGSFPSSNTTGCSPGLNQNCTNTSPLAATKSSHGAQFLSAGVAEGHGLAGVSHRLIQVEIRHRVYFPGLHLAVDEIHPPLVNLAQQPAQRSAFHLDPHGLHRQRFALNQPPGDGQQVVILLALTHRAGFDGSEAS